MQNESAVHLYLGILNKFSITNYIWMCPVFVCLFVFCCCMFNIFPLQTICVGVVLFDFSLFSFSKQLCFSNCVKGNVVLDYV